MKGSGSLRPIRGSRQGLLGRAVLLGPPGTDGFWGQTDSDAEAHSFESGLRAPREVAKKGVRPHSAGRKSPSASRAKQVSSLPPFFSFSL